MDSGLVERAKYIIADVIYMTIATSSKNGIPWNSPVYYSYDENYNFYWRSGKDSQHSKNIRENNNIFIAIYDSRVSWGEGEGVYVQAKAYELTDEKEIDYALDLHYKRESEYQQKQQAAEFLGDNPRRVYTAIPEKVWINQDSWVDGKFVDTRVEIDLLSITR